MSTDNLTADRLSQLLSSCRERSTEMIKRYIEGTGDLGSIYDDLESWYDRYRDGNLPMPQYQDLPSPVQDQLFDAWIEGVEGYFAKRAAGSDSKPSDASSPPQPLHAKVQDDGCAVCGEVVTPFGPGICPKCRNPYYIIQASPEGSVCEVEPLGEVGWSYFADCECIEFKDGWGHPAILLGGKKSITLDRKSAFAPSLSKIQLPSLIAHLTSWLETGSFRLNTALGEEQKGGAGV